MTFYGEFPESIRADACRAGGYSPAGAGGIAVDTAFEHSPIFDSRGFETVDILAGSFASPDQSGQRDYLFNAKAGLAIALLA